MRKLFSAIFVLIFIAGFSTTSFADSPIVTTVFTGNQVISADINDSTGNICAVTSNGTATKISNGVITPLGGNNLTDIVMFRGVPYFISSTGIQKYDNGSFTAVPGGTGNFSYLITSDNKDLTLYAEGSSGRIQNSDGLSFYPHPEYHQRNSYEMYNWLVNYLPSGMTLSTQDGLIVDPAVGTVFYAVLTGNSSDGLYVLYKNGANYTPVKIASGTAKIFRAFQNNGGTRLLIGTSLGLVFLDVSQSMLNNPALIASVALDSNVYSGNNTPGQTNTQQVSVYIHCVDSATNNPITSDSCYGSVIIGTNITINAPSLNGYTPTQYSQVFTPAQYSTTVVFRYTPTSSIQTSYGNQVAIYTQGVDNTTGNIIASNTYYTTATVGATLTVSAPPVSNYTPTQPSQTIIVSASTSTAVFRYTPTSSAQTSYGTVAIYTHIVDTTGKNLRTQDEYYGSGVPGGFATIPAPFFANYTPLETSKTVGVIAGLNTVTFVYTLISTAATTQAAATQASSKVIKLYIGKKLMINNGDTVSLDCAPEIKDGRTFLPIRPVVDALKGTITWIPSDNRVDIKKDATSISLWISQHTAIVNGINKEVDSNSSVVPYIKDGRTMLPLRFAIESLGAKVDWDEATQMITISQ